MSTSTVDNHFSFSLPSLSYVDTSLEDQNRAEDAVPSHAGGLVVWLATRFSAIRTWNTQRRSLNELSRMTDRELTDVGLNRSDFARMFDDSANADLRARGSL